MESSRFLFLLLAPNPLFLFLFPFIYRSFFPFFLVHVWAWRSSLLFSWLHHPLLYLPLLAGKLLPHCSGLTPHINAARRLDGRHLMRRWQLPSRYLSRPTIAFCLIFTPLFRCRIGPRRCSEWLASSIGTSDKGAEVTIVLGYGTHSLWPAAPLLGWKFYPLLGWSSSDVRIPSYKTLGRAFPFTLLEPRAKLAHTHIIWILLKTHQ